MANIWTGVEIGAAGGAIAGIMVYAVQYLHTKGKEWIEKRRVYRWLRRNTADEDGERFRSTRAIASYNNLTQDRVRYICSIHKKIHLSTGDREDLWGLYDHGERSVYEKRGLRTVG